ncbi:uncharacterized protein LOC121864190 [Homarus americanus]|nr:uncharacterized protein LOC121864190 [Homarus americanus]
MGGTTSDMGGTTSDMGGTTSVMGGTTSDMGGTTSDMGGTTSDMGGTTSDMGGTTSVMGGTTSVMGGTTSGTTVALSGITQSGNTRPPVPGATLYQLEDNVRVWTCDQPDSVWSNQRNTLLVFPWDTTWDNPGNCTAGYSDSQPCSTPDPPQQLIDATFRETLSRESGEVYALYYQCDNGLEVYPPVIGILLLCVDGTWFPASNDSCISGELYNNQYKTTVLHHTTNTKLQYSTTQQPT